MFADALKTTGLEGRLAVKDLAELVAEAVGLEPVAVGSAPAKQRGCLSRLGYASPGWLAAVTSRGEETAMNGNGNRSERSAFTSATAAPTSPAQWM